VLRVYPAPQEEIPLADLYRDLCSAAKAANHEAMPYTVANMVASLDGRATAGGVAGHIGGSVDRQAMRVLRSRSDAVLVGAASLRAEKMSLSVPEDEARACAQPLAVVVTSSAEVDLSNLLSHPRQEVLVVSHRAVRIEPGNVPRPLISTERLSELASSTPRSAFDPAPLLEALRHERGVEVLLSEGGPSVNHALAASGLLDEFFLTLSPRTLAGSPHEAMPLLSGPALDTHQSNWSLASIHLPCEAHVEQDMLLRYTRGSITPPP
jgi:riboflavin biosynthesis pyrimidine reductase